VVFIFILNASDSLHIFEFVTSISIWTDVDYFVLLFLFEIKYDRFLDTIYINGYRFVSFIEHADCVTY